MIKFNEKTPPTTAAYQAGWRIMIVNDEQLQSSEMVQLHGGQWFGFIRDSLESKKLFSFALKEIESSIYQVEMTLDEIVDRWLRLRSANLTFSSAADPESKLTLVFKPDFDNWTSPFSASAYLQAFKEVAKSSSVGEPEFRPDITDGFGVICVLRNKDLALKELISERMDAVRQLSSIAAEEALRTVRKNSLVTWFNFPASIKTSCEQYLIYFVQFLEDLGIKANSEIKDDAGRILFSVTPADGASALGNIKQALEAYLDLPRNPEFNAVADEFSDMAVSQLKANVFFLKSQLALAQAMLEAKNATIEALNFTIFQQRQLQTGSASSGNPKENDKDSEPIIGDTVHLTKFEGKFLKVDLPTILRRLKRSFGIGETKDEPKS